MPDPGNRKRHILVFSALFPPAFLGGGPIKTLDSMLRAAPSSVTVSVLTADRDLNETTRLPVVSNEWEAKDFGRVRFVSSEKIGELAKAWWSSRKPSPGVVYLNGFFNAKYSIFPHMLARLGFWGRIHVLLAPRGEFSPGALEIKASKKLLFIKLFKLSGAPTRTIWHASTVEEADHIRAVMGDRSTVLIRENETSLPAMATPALGNQRDTLHMVFLSRVSPKKGLDVLLAALRNVSQPVTLDIYGPEEDVAYSARCHQIAESLPDHVLCRFKGPVPVAQVRETFAQYDLFVLPTAGENFGHVIAESLSVSCPVMCADTTPWSRLLAAGGGVVVPERTPLGWGRAIESYALKGRSGWLEMRQSSTGAYDSWMAGSKEPHIFEQLSQHLA